MKKTCRILCALGVATLLGGSAPADAAPKMKTHVVDVGTGLGVYVEFPPGPGRDRPTRVVYDTGKGAGKGLDNDLVSFLASEKIGLKVAEGDFEGDVIDYFILSHPHEDHYNGAMPLFDLFDVRNVIEGKQIHSIKYLKRFKSPALQEIRRAKLAGKDAHYYVVGLPYPNGFDQPRGGRPYDEYALCQKNLPEFMKDTVDCAGARGKVTWPFGPAQVAQRVVWPMKHLMGESEKGITKYLPEELHDETLEVDILPVGTRFDVDTDTNAGFTIVHSDTIAAFDHSKNDRTTYKEAFPYYKEDDLNDGSVAIQLTYGNASLLITGDTEGRDHKPKDKVALTDIFGSGTGQDAYDLEYVKKHLRLEKAEDEQLPLVPMADPYVVGAEDLLRLGYYAFTSYDWLNPEPFDARLDGDEFTVAAKTYASPEDIPEEAVYMDRRSEFQRERLHPRWRERLWGFFDTLRVNGQKKNAMKSRFSYWIRGSKPRLIKDEELDRFRPEWEEPVWNITSLVQLTERVYYVDPYLAHILAGFIMRSDLFLDYVAPRDREEQIKRGEKHMVHVADQILTEGGPDVVKSDVLFFGHHGSFTSSSYGFVHRVDPNVGIISADDKSYSGSTLPDFSAMFWNLNTHHPNARAILHSMFFHADILAMKRGEPVDGYAWRNRFSQSAARIFRRRSRWPIPIWRTDFNDDLEDVNTLMDNISIETDGREPIWKWARHVPGEEQDFIPDDQAGEEHLPKWQYWFQTLGYNPKRTGAIRPFDPSGQIETYAIGSRIDIIDEWDWSLEADEEEPEDWTHHH